MKQLTFDNVYTLLRKNRKQGKAPEWNKKIVTSIQKEISSFFDEKAILGVDIYQYSQYPQLEQSLIPHLFKSLYNATIQNCLDHESYIFQTLKSADFEEHFIDTGDGGFQIFDSPFHAVIFAIYFQANIKRYNSGKDTVHFELRKIVGEITLRYSITYGKIYRYAKNFYGPAIIANARIMSRDRLNRVLIDENTFCWFTQTINGIENLQVIDAQDFDQLDFFKKYKNTKAKNQSLIFEGDVNSIKSVHILKIGEIKSKQDVVSIHSLHIQTILNSKNVSGLRTFTISLGNLNSSGIAE
jgi:hypothetical protein